MVSLESDRAERRGVVEREDLLAAIRAAAQANTGRILTCKKFLAASKMTSRDIWGNFSSWNEALKAAGFAFKKSRQRVKEEILLEDWGRVARAVGRIPTIEEYIKLGYYCRTTLERRFGFWKAMPHAFCTMAAGDPQWDDVLSLFPGAGLPARASKGHGWKRGQGTDTSPFAHSWKTRNKERPVCGDPIHLDAMSHGPVNEAGVVYLFGALAPRLGFTVESMRPGFPDCEAKRRIGPDAWQTVRIEFEYESRNFRIHRHQPDGCDLIVCWNHNWPECPERLKVISLSEEVAKLRKARPA